MGLRIGMAPSIWVAIVKDVGSVHATNPDLARSIWEEFEFSPFHSFRPSQAKPIFRSL
jgi:hypothetical protein